ncbi:YhgN family NAAT transporter [Pseudaeromonas pectinilytica]|mgnify:FL=1|jgi:multiple antibiotic resistance protein|nr:YhgN family NAAT transporter [Aeromonadaceae bacterium]MBP8772225.1 YhgN family NAAT transporter [Aeromonadaceae bacterium]
MDIITAAVMLFLIMDPVGNLPVFLSILRHLPAERRRKVMIRELLISLVVLLLFLFAGQEILNLLNLKQEAVSISGGIVLFLIAIRMIFPSEGGVTGLPEGEEPLIVPMAIPMIAGPSILAALLLLAHQYPHQMTDWTLALLLAWSASSIILMFYEQINRMLGDRVLQALERLMGMLLVMISVQMLLDGAVKYLS